VGGKTSVGYCGRVMEGMMRMIETIEEMKGSY